MSEIRLGDVVDDYCSRCRLETNHSVVSLVNGQPAKVHCRTCFYEHNYGAAKSQEKRKSTKKAKLFDDVLSSITGTPKEEEKR